MTVTFIRVGVIVQSASGAKIKGKLENGLFEPLGILQLQAFLDQNNIQNNFIDLVLECKDNYEKILNQIIDNKPDVVAFPILFSMMEIEVEKFANLLKQNGFKGHITAGGNKATVAPKTVLKKCPSLDSVIVGDGEKPLVELVVVIKNNRNIFNIPGVLVRNASVFIRQSPNNLSDIPIPKREQIYGKISGVGCVQSSRGCQGSCTYCSIHGAYLMSGEKNKWREKKIDNVINDIENTLKILQVNEIWFVDDNFIGPNKLGEEHAIKLSYEIKRRFPNIRFIIQTRADTITNTVIKALKEAGLIKVFLGVESGIYNQLKRYGKLTNINKTEIALKILDENKIYSEIGIIGFDPYVSLDEIKDNISFLLHLAKSYKYLHIYSFNPLTPFEGTPIHKSLKKMNLLEYTQQSHDPICRYNNQKIGMMANKIFEFYAEFGLLSEAIRRHMSTNLEILPFLREKNLLFCELLDVFIKNCWNNREWNHGIKGKIKALELKWINFLHD